MRNYVITIIKVGGITDWSYPFSSVWDVAIGGTRVRKKSRFDAPTKSAAPLIGTGRVKHGI